eukprot:scaffold18034_cov166-Skeletonema_marinoi.AAC.4
MLESMHAPTPGFQRREKTDHGAHIHPFNFCLLLFFATITCRSSSSLNPYSCCHYHPLIVGLDYFADQSLAATYLFY